MNVKLLDCTLRDGAHVTSGRFGYNHIINIAETLSEAKIDIVELGFLRQIYYDQDISSFPHMDEAYKVVDKLHLHNKNAVEYALMVRADEYNVDDITECTGKIKILRIAFYYDYLEKAIIFAKKVIAKKYQVSLNLINTPGCTKEELEDFVECANKIRPYAVSIVDTFGVLDLEELEKIINLYDLKLDKNIRIGLHVHENYSLSFALAQLFLQKMQGDRGVIVDGSLMGIGRNPGNLCTEIIANYLNKRFDKQYDLNKILKSIDYDILPLKEKFRWGYSPEYFISALHKVHRSYAETLYKMRFEVAQIDIILSKIDKCHAGKFDKRYLEELILDYQRK